MRNIVSLCAGMALCLAFAAQGVSAQTGTSGAPANAQAVQSGNVKTKFKTINKLSATTQKALQNDGDSNGNGGGNGGGNNGRMSTIPHWHGSLRIKESHTHTSWPDAIRVMAARLWLERR